MIRRPVRNVVPAARSGDPREVVPVPDLEIHGRTLNCTEESIAREPVVSAVDPDGRKMLRLEVRNSQTPIERMPLSMGTYLVELSAPGHVTVRYPVNIEREEHWDGVPPGEHRTRPIRLPRQGELGPDDCYVPPGWFACGGDPLQGRSLSARRVWVDGHVFKRFPVTNADYAEFVANTRALPPAWWGGRQPPEDKRTHPVVGVTIAQARAYAEWRGKRLPTTLEWVAAARGSDNTLMPWGESCVDKACHCPRNRPRTTAPVDAHPAGRSGEGVQDLIGNVWEWTERHDALLPDDADYHFVMGGSFKHRCTFPSQLPRTAVSKHGEYLYLGFRCARDPGVSNA